MSGPDGEAARLIRALRVRNVDVCAEAPLDQLAAAAADRLDATALLRAFLARPLGEIRAAALWAGDEHPAPVLAPSPIDLLREFYAIATTRSMVGRRLTVTGRYDPVTVRWDPTGTHSMVGSVGQGQVASHKGGAE